MSMLRAPITGVQKRERMKESNKKLFYFQCTSGALSNPFSRNFLFYNVEYSQWTML